MAPPQIVCSSTAKPAVRPQTLRRDGSDVVLRVRQDSDISVGVDGSGAQVMKQPHEEDASSQPWRLWREVSVDYTAEVGGAGCHLAGQPDFDLGGMGMDPPTKLIENFLQRQAASGDMCLDMDVGMMEKLPPVMASAESGILLISQGKEAKMEEEQEEAGRVNTQRNRKTPCVRTVSFAAGQDRGSKDDSEVDANGDCGDASSSEEEAEISHRSAARYSLHRAQTRSRLADSSEDPRIAKKSATQQQVRSGAAAPKSGTAAAAAAGVDEDDDILDEDIPDEMRKGRRKPSLTAVLQLAAFLAIMAWLVCSLTVPDLIRRPLWSMALWKWALLVLLIFCGRLVSGWAVAAAVAAMERSFLLRRRVLYFVYALRKGFQNTVWFAFALLAWRLVFDPKAESAAGSAAASAVLPYVTKTLSCLLIAATIWLVKIFLVKVLASSFHVSTYFERIRESLFAQWVLETLSGPPAMEMEEEREVMTELDGLRRNAGAKLPASILSPPPPPPKTGAVYGRRSGGVTGITPRSGVVGKSGVMKSGYVGRSGVIVGGGGGGVRKSGYVGRSGIIVGGGGGGVRKSGLVMKSGYVGKSGAFPPPPPPAPSEEKNGSNGGGSDDGGGITIDHLRRLNRNNVSAWNMKRLMNVVRYRGICTLAHVIDESSVSVGDDGGAQDVEIQSAWQAKAAAKTIFKNVAKPGARYIDRNDLLRFMRATEVERALALFEGARETGRISKAALKNFAVHVVRERRALAVSLTDTKTAVKKLHRIVDVVVGVIILIIWLLVLGLATTHLLLVISSQLVLVVFIVGNTCKNVFEAIVFLFVMHPFDVGDRCIVDGYQLVVEEMNILSTLFMKGDGERVWYPNSLLATKYIFNYSRTPDNSDSFDFSIDANTPSEKITQLKEKISKYIASKPNLWAESHHLIVKSIENDNKMTMQLNVNHTINYNEDLERRIRKSDLIIDVKKMLQELDIGYKLLPQEIQLSYSYSSMEPMCQKEGGPSHLKLL